MINKQLINLSSPASSGGGTGNQEEGLILHLDANDVDSYDGDGSEWVDITNHEYTPATNVDEHFNTVLYTGNGSTNVITGVGFQPDIVWIKNRDDSEHHTLFDSMSGADYSNYINLALGQGTGEAFASFDTDGFTLDTGHNRQNASGDDYVAWCFKAGGAPSGSDKVSIDGASYATMGAAGLTDGTEPISKLSVNTKLGFSIVKYTAPALTGDTVAHGLGETPEMIILKSTSVARNWNVFHKGVGTSKNLHLNTTDAANTGEYWTANSNTFSIQDYSVSADWIAYAFTSKRGVSKVGSFEGTGAAGNKIYTGFEPAFVMLKNADSGASNSHWFMWDNQRGESEYLTASTSSIAGADASVDFHTDGFTVPNAGAINVSAQTHIYYAVAKNTNETSLTPDRASFTEGSITTGAELKLDANDYSGSGNWLDSSGNSNDATITGATYVDDGNLDYFTFTGGSEHRVTIDDNGALTNVSNFTVELWANIKDNNGYRYLWTNMHTTNGQRQVYCYVDNSDRVEFTVYSGNGTNDYKIYLTSSVASTIHNKWVHYAFVLSNGLPSKIYLNGVDTPISVGSTGSGFGSAMHTSSTTDFAIGSIQNTGDTANANGDIGQFRIYSSALTPTQVQTNYDATKGLYAYPDLALHLDADSFPQYGEAGYSDTPSTWTALTGSNGTITGTTFDSELGNYLNIASASDYVDVPTANMLDSDFTIEMWCNQDSVSGSYKMLLGGSGYSGQTGLGHYISGAAIITWISVSGTATNVLTSSNVLVANKWQHIVLKREGTTWTQYVDGELVATATGSSAAISSPDSRIGRHYNVTDYSAPGKYGQVRIYSSAITQDQIRQNYNFTKNNYPNGNDGTISGATWNPSGYFDFDGSNDYIQTDLTISSSSVTTSIWFNADATNAQEIIHYFQNNGGRIDVSIGGTGSNSATASYERINVTCTTATSQWNHLAIVYTGWANSYSVNSYGSAITAKVYLNDSLVATVSPTPYGQTTGMRIGRSGGGYYYDGKVSKVKIFDKELTSSEITTLHSEGE